MRVAIIDNYDSFTYNLVHAVEQFCDELEVMRNDEVNLDSLENFDRIILSPGPGLPSEVKVLEQILNRFAGKLPIFGVCLGLQSIGEFFGAKLYNLDQVDHGIPKNTIVTDSNEILFQGIDREFDSGRYHSWALATENFPECLKVTATDDNGVIMAIRHRELDICGVQFHPESIMTPKGNQMMANWMK
ncbi:MAG: aminodeoxychorismate/anthranilate synthase component II [Marinifilaceae bacterium]